MGPLPYTVTLVQVGVDFRKIGVWLSLSEVVRSSLRLQTPVDGIPHPYYIYAKHFSTSLSCGWAYGSTPLHCYACAGGGGF